MTKKLLVIILLALAGIPLAQAQDGATDPNVLTYTLFHDDFLEGVAWSPDGNRIMSHDLFKIYVWNANNGEEIVRITPESSIINARWSQDGTLILALTVGNNLSAWDATTGEIYFFNDNAVEFGWSMDNRRAMTVNYETVQLWDTTTGQMLQEVEGVGIFSLSPDGQYLLAWSVDLTIWQSNDPGAEPITVSSDAGIGSVQWSNDSQKLAVVFFDGTIGIIDPSTGQTLQQFTVDLQTGSIPGQIKWNTNDNYLLAQVGTSNFYVWDTLTGSTLLHINTEGTIINLDWNKTGDRVLATIEREAGQIASWSVPDGELVFNILVGPNLTGATWSADDRFVALRERGMGLVVRTAEGMGIVFGIMIPEPPVPLWHPTAPRFLTVWGNTINIWDLERSALFPQPPAPISVTDLLVDNRCYNCHFSDNPYSGPSLADGILGEERRSNDGQVVVADEAYIRESIVNPNVFIVEGYYAGSHSTYYGARLTEEELDMIVSYIMSLSE